MRGRGLGAGLVLFLLLTPEAWAGSLRAESGGLRVELASEPERPIQGRETLYTLSLREATGQPVGGAKVTLLGRMPDGMTVLVPLRGMSQVGIYSGRVLFTMEGEWRFTVRISLTDKPLKLSFKEQVGR